MAFRLKLSFPSLWLLLVLLIFVVIVTQYYHKESVDGGYSNWSFWGNCSRPCGEGILTRTRRCDNPAPGNFGFDCSRLGLDSETKECFLKMCPVDGQFGEWSVFGECDKPCGGGVQKKTRGCNNPPAAFGGKPCEGISEETKSCNPQPCPVNGGFSEWSAFDACSVTCGTGKHSRSRQCNKPEPSNGGKPCEGATSETHDCVLEPCKQAEVPTNTTTPAQPSTKPSN